MSKSEIEKLIEASFQGLLTIHEDQSFKGKNREYVVEWWRNQLAQLGYYTVPVGSAWACPTNQDSYEKHVARVHKQPNVPDDQPCMEKNCVRYAVTDYNGHGHYVCQHHFNKLSDYFDEEYR